MPPAQLPSSCPAPALCPCSNRPLGQIFHLPSLASCGSRLLLGRCFYGPREWSWLSGCICLLAGRRVYVGVSPGIPSGRKPEDVTVSHAVCHLGIGNCPIGSGGKCSLFIVCSRDYLLLLPTLLGCQPQWGTPGEVSTSSVSGGTSPGSAFLCCDIKASHVFEWATLPSHCPVYSGSGAGRGSSSWGDGTAGPHCVLR